MTTSPNQEYPAGHPHVSSAAFSALMHFFGSGQLANPVVATNTCGSLVFPSLKDAVDSVINARVWGGVHFRSSDEVGAKAGKELAHYVYKHFLTPL